MIKKLRSQTRLWVMISGLVCEGIVGTAVAHAEAKIYRDLPYRSGSTTAENALDLYLPGTEPTSTTPTKSSAEKVGLFPVFLFIHGGAWISGDKAEYAGIGKSFATQGIAVAVINYRLSGSSGSGEVAHVQDGNDAVTALKWLVANTEKYHLNSKRIFVGGHSAGAQITGIIAAQKDLATQVAGFIGLEGIYDIEKLVELRPQYIDQFIATSFTRNKAAWQSASPQRKPFSVPIPWVIVHSEKDELVELSQSEQFVEHLRHFHIAVDYYKARTPNHFEAVAALEKPIDPITIKIRNFILAMPTIPKKP
jgi:acetyl esterase/lipase